MTDLTKLTIAQARDAMRKGETTSAETVSYTHLTLPTILLV